MKKLKLKDKIIKMKMEKKKKLILNLLFKNVLEKL